MMNIILTKEKLDLVWGILLSISGILNAYILFTLSRKVHELRHLRDRDRMQIDMISGLITRIIRILEANKLK